jgi:thiol-disulfide isomerase/thioredoxin
MILYVLISQGIHAQGSQPKTYKLFVNLEKAPFDSLYLHDYTEGRDIFIAGKKTKSFTWEINIPNTIVWDSENIELLASPYDSKSNSFQSIRFITKRAGKKVIIGNVGVDDENTYIYGTYLDTAQFSPDQVIVKTGNKHSITVGNLICADFNLIVKDGNSDIAVRSEDPFFSWFVDSYNEKLTYDEALASYITIAKKHPNSRFLVTYLACNLTRYHSKDDVKKVYVNFSGKRKNTIWAKKIEHFLYDKKFPNTSLPTFHRNTSENIVQDFSKYNLIIFTASWCAPCREEIPLLKKIYKDLGKSLILTYVSIDNAQSVVSMQKLIREKNIPWRTLFAYQDVEKIKRKYFIEGIPHNTLIYPNQHMEIMDVRKDDDRAKLYSIVKSHGNKKQLIR